MATKAKQESKEESKEVAIPTMDKDALAGINDFESAIAAVREQFPDARIATADELGDGFSLLKDKDTILGLPTMFVTWVFSMGDFGEFVSARVIVKYPGANNFVKYVINDGSTGVYEMLKGLTDKDPDAKLLYAEKGLRKSDYIGPEGPATTYYIDTSKAAVNA